MSSIYQTLQNLLYSGQGVGVLFCASVKVVEVNAELKAAILLPYQYYCIAPHTLAKPDSTRLQHLPQVVPNLLNQWRGNPPKSLFKRECHLSLLSCVWWSGSSPILWGPMRTHHGTQPGASGWHPPALDTKNPTHSNPVH